MARYGNQSGFTLPELLVITFVAALGMLVTIVLLKPADLTDKHNDAIRRTDIAQIAQAVHHYKHDTGHPPDGLTQDEVAIGSAADEYNLCRALVPAYLPDLPADPDYLRLMSSDKRCDHDAAYKTYYAIRLTAAGRVVISAPLAASGTPSVTIL